MLVHCRLLHEYAKTFCPWSAVKWMQSLLAILLVIIAVPEGCNCYQHQVVLAAVQMGSMGTDCHCTNTVTENRQNLLFLFQVQQKGKKQTRGKYLSTLLKLHSKLWWLHNTPPHPQTWPGDRVTMSNNFIKKHTSIIMQITFFLESFR